MQLRQKFKDITDAGARVLAVAPDRPEALAVLHKALKLPFPLLGDPMQTVYKQYGLTEKSYTLDGDFVIDEQGIVRYAHRGLTPDDRPPFDEIRRALENAVHGGEAGG